MGVPPSRGELTAIRAGTTPASHRAPRSTADGAWRWSLGSWALLRGLSWLGAWISTTWLTPGTTVQVPGYTPPVLHGVAGVLAGSWLRADALWYLRIAQVGYRGDTRTFAFLPLFAELVRPVAWILGGRELYAALLVASVACALGFVWLYRFFDLVAGPTIARATVVGLAVYPAAFFLVAPYGEPLLLAAGAGALLAAARGRPGLAAFAGALAALSRPFGVFIALPLLAFALNHRRQWRWWVAPIGPVAGSAAWLLWSGHQLGSLLGVIRIQSVWQRTTSFPWATLDAGVRSWWLWQGTSYGPYFVIDLLASVLGILLVVGTVLVLVRHRRDPWLTAGLAAYGLLVLAAPLSSPFPGRPLMSVPRFLLALFPLFAACAAFRPRWSIPAAVASAGGLVWLTALYVAARPIF